jgi:hypothetical protein
LAQCEYLNHTPLSHPLAGREIAQFYAPETKILEGTKDEMRISKEALFNGSWPKLSTHALEKCFLRNPHFIFCSSFQNLRLGGVNFLVDARRTTMSERLHVIHCLFEALFSESMTGFWLSDGGSTTYFSIRFIIEQ